MNTPHDHINPVHCSACQEYDRKVADLYEPGAAEMTHEQVLSAVDAVVRAIKDAGPQPTYHREIMARHRSEWPTLWTALDRLARAALSGGAAEPEK